MDLSQFHATFFAESTDQLNIAEAALLALEKGQTAQGCSDHQGELINQVFRAVHSTKGSAGTLGFESIAQLAHELEELFEAVRKKSIELSADVFTTAYQGLDLLGALTDDAQYQTALTDSGRVAALVEHIGHLIQKIEPIETAAANTAVADVIRTTEYAITFVPHASFSATGNDPILYLRELSTLGQAQISLDTKKLPSLTEMAAGQVYVRWQIRLVTEKSETHIREVFDWVADVCDLSIQELISPTAKTLPLPNQASTAGAPSKQSPTVHVRADRLDNLINQLGELAISHSYLKTSVAALGSADSLSASLMRLERQVRDLQDTVLGLRMLPLKVLFGRFDRVVRDAAADLDKTVELIVDGSDTELDKNLIEKLVDPLTHLVRNALDHGIDTPEQRRVQGKSPVGTITLSARHEAGSVVLSVIDDGQGIDSKKIRQRAIDLGMASGQENFDDKQWLQFIYRPGFSTTSQANQWSGRGVGLDAVQQAVRSLGGELFLDSHEGHGTQFHMRVPLTLAILDALMIKVSGQTYAVPLTCVRECITAKQLRLSQVNQDQFVGHVAGQLVPAVDLAQYLQTGSYACNEMSANATFILVYSGDEKLLLGVEEILGQDQIVVRSLEKNFRNPTYANGATLLGNGAVALILDSNALIRSVKNEPIPQL
jgi:two-component system, chemotaxis family, sensor kinase CheA